MSTLSPPRVEKSSPWTSLKPAASESPTMPLVRDLRTSDLAVVFQPIVDLRTGRIFAQEALVRCTVPAFESPLELFEQASKESWCGRLGRMIRGIAIPLASGIPLFINIHPDELVQSWLVRPDDPIFFHDHDVYLEVTESVPLSHADLCAGVLNELRARAGMHVVVDDLGAGYSNLKRIADLEPGVVKLDRDLVAGIERFPRQQRLVASIVRLCNDLGALVVAEGIETADELAVVRDCGAELAQGYYLARPGYPPPTVDPRKLLV